MMMIRRRYGFGAALALLAILLGCTPAATTSSDEGAKVATTDGGASSTAETAGAGDEDAGKGTTASTQEGGTTTGKTWKDLEYPPLTDPKLPKIHKETLDNGLQLLIVEDHELPLVSASAMIRVGSVYEPAEKAGLASMAGTVMRSGGTEANPGDELDAALEDIAASVETGIGSTSGSASLSCLKENFEEVLGLFADVLMNPAFPEEKIDLAKVQARSAIARRNDDAGGITSREFAKLLYGPDSPYARTTEYATIDAITRDDLVAYHEAFFHPDRTILAVWGDVDTARTKEAVKKALGGWAKSDGSVTTEIPQPKPNDAPKVNFIRKTDINQTNIRIGHMGVRRDHPDYYAIVILNDILGGGFSSRLFSEVRTKRGYAYSVGSRFSAPMDRPGPFAMICQTKSESTHAAITAIIGEAKRIRDEGVTDEELQKAKDGNLESFVFNFATASQIIGRQMSYTFYGYPEDLLEQYRKGIAGVTKEAVQAAAKKHIRPDDFIILAVGRDEDFDEPLSKFGEVNVIDIESALEISMAGGGAAATPESLAAGRALLAEAAAAHGGLEKFQGLQGYVIEATMKSPAAPGMDEMVERATKVFLKYPDSARLEAEGQMGMQAFIVNPDGAWMQMGANSMPMPPNFRGEIRDSLHRNVFGLLRAFDNEGSEARLLEGEEGAEGVAQVLVKLSVGGEIKATVDPESKRVVAISYMAMNPMTGAPQQRSESFDDFREVDGFVVPFKRTTMDESGEVIGEVLIQSIEIDGEMDDSLFADPTAS